MQPILDKTVNVVSTTYEGELSPNNCYHPFYSPDNLRVGYWVRDFDYDNSTYLNTYQLYIKDLVYGVLIKIDGNGNCPFNTTLFGQAYIHGASFSPDSTKILFQSTSTNLDPTDTVLSLTSPIDEVCRWFVKDISFRDYNNSITKRISKNETSFGSNYDGSQAIWYSNDEIAFTSYSSLVTGALDGISNVYLKNITDESISLISRKETSNISPYLTTDSYNIAVTTDKIAFYNDTLNQCIKSISDTSLTLISTLSGFIDNDITTAQIVSFYQNKFIFRVATGNSIPEDINFETDDFVYDLTNSSIIKINEGDFFGNYGSYSASFSPDGNSVAFLSKSDNLIEVQGGYISLYVKNLVNNSIAVVSKNYGNGDMNSDTYGYTWLDDGLIAFTNGYNQLELSGIMWYVRDLYAESTRQINNIGFHMLFVDSLSDINNDVEGNIRRETFNINGDTILYSGKLVECYEDIFEFDVLDNINNIFQRTFIDKFTSEISLGNIYPEANFAINVTLKNNHSADVYTYIDTIQGNETFGIIGSQYIERVNSIRYRNENTNIRWMGINIPFTPSTIYPVRIGTGIFRESSTLLTDIIGIKQSGFTTSTNPVIGIISLFDIPISYSGLFLRTQNYRLVNANDNYIRIVKGDFISTPTRNIYPPSIINQNYVSNDINAYDSSIQFIIYDGLVNENIVSDIAISEPIVTVLDMRFQDNDGSIIFIDDTSINTPTAFGNAAILDNAAYFNNDGYIEINSSYNSNFNFIGDWEITCDIKLDSIDGLEKPIWIFGENDGSTDSDSAYNIWLVVQAGLLILKSGKEGIRAIGGSMSANTLYSIKVERIGLSINGYIDDILTWSISETPDMLNPPSLQPTEGLGFMFVGGNANPNRNKYVGFIDNILVKNFHNY